MKLKRRINGEEELSRWVDEKMKEELGIIEYKTGVGLNPEEYERSKSAAKKNSNGNKTWFVSAAANKDTTTN